MTTTEIIPQATIDRLRADAADLQRTFASSLDTLGPSFAAAADLLATCLQRGGKVLACGNGGSAADADHLVAELVGRFGYDRDALPGVSLTVNSATVTAIANDYGYEHLFSRQVAALGRAPDVVVGISTSGRSANVLAALALARKNGLGTLAFTGAADSPMAQTADVVLRPPAHETPRIQEWHILLIHSLCREIELRLFPKPIPRLPAGKFVARADVPALVAARGKRRTVFTNGCFDILHPGHVHLLAHARSLGDLLILGLNTDESVQRLKGPTRPIHGLRERADVLMALTAVDFVVPFAEDTPLELITELTPSVLVKGGDYTRDSVVGADHVEKHGGTVVIVPLREGHSTTRILTRSSGPGNHRGGA